MQHKNSSALLLYHPSFLIVGSETSDRKEVLRLQETVLVSFQSSVKQFFLQINSLKKRKCSSSFWCTNIGGSKGGTPGTCASPVQLSWEFWPVNGLAPHLGNPRSRIIRGSHFEGTNFIGLVHFDWHSYILQISCEKLSSEIFFRRRNFAVI